MKNEYSTDNGQLTISIEENDLAIILKWHGKSTSLYPSDFLDPVFEEVLAKNKKIIMDFSRLIFITSSTLTPIIKLLDKIKNGSGEIELQYKENIDWQFLTFSAFAVFSECGRIKITSI